MRSSFFMPIAVLGAFTALSVASVHAAGRPGAEEVADSLLQFRRRWLAGGPVRTPPAGRRLILA